MVTASSRTITPGPATVSVGADVGSTVCVSFLVGSGVNVHAGVVVGEGMVKGPGVRVEMSSGLGVGTSVALGSADAHFDVVIGEGTAKGISVCPGVGVEMSSGLDVRTSIALGSADAHFVAVGNNGPGLGEGTMQDAAPTSNAARTPKTRLCLIVILLLTRFIPPRPISEII